MRLVTIHDIIWSRVVVEKIQSKHGISPEEVEYALEHRPYIQFHQPGEVKGEELYIAWGRTAAGRYVVVYFILKKGRRALPISARQMTRREKRLYGRKKKKKD